MRNLRLSLLAAFAVLGMFATFAPKVAHAQTAAPITRYNDGEYQPYTYNVATGIPAGATDNNMSGGSTLTQQVVATDYGQIANVFFTRFTPALVVVGIAGAVLLASAAAVRMIHGRLSGAFH